MAKKPGDPISYNLSPPRLEDGRNLFDTRIERVFTELVPVREYVKNAVEYSDAEIGDLARLFQDYDADTSQVESEFNEIVFKAEGKLGDVRFLPNTVELRLLLAESEAISARNNAIAEIRNAVNRCECPENEGQPNPDGTCGIRTPGQWYQGGIFLGSQTLPDGRVVDLIADYENRSQLMEFGPSGTYLDASSMEDGRTNTSTICAAGPAVTYATSHTSEGCGMTFNDYFLPSQAQLQRLAQFVNLQLPAWSSTQLASGTFQSVQSGGSGDRQMSQLAQVIPFRQDVTQSSQWSIRDQSFPVSGAVRSMAFSYGKDMLAVASGKSMYILSTEDFSVVDNWEFIHEVTSLHFRPDNQVLFVGRNTGWLGTYHLDEERSFGTSLPGSVIGQTINPQGTETIAIHGSPNPGARVLSLPELDNGYDLKDVMPDFNPSLGYGATYSHDDNWLALAGFPGGEIRVVSTSDWNNQVSGVPSLDGRAQSLAYTKDDNYIVVVQRLPASYSGPQASVMLLDTQFWTFTNFEDQPPASAVHVSMGDGFASVMTADPSNAAMIYNSPEWRAEDVPNIGHTAYVSRWLSNQSVIVGHQGGLSILDRTGYTQAEEGLPVCGLPPPVILDVIPDTYFFTPPVILDVIPE